jgi:hypothetical protein
MEPTLRENFNKFPADLSEGLFAEDLFGLSTIFKP